MQIKEKSSSILHRSISISRLLFLYANGGKPAAMLENLQIAILADKEKSLSEQRSLKTACVFILLKRLCHDSLIDCF